MSKYDWLLSTDWSRVDQIEQWNTGDARIHYRVMSSDWTEEEIRENMLYWNFENVYNLFKVYKINDDFMREIQSNLAEEDLRMLEHQIMTDCYLPRQCFPEQIQNYNTYFRACKIMYQENLKEEKNFRKMLIRLDCMMRSYSYDGEVASYTDNCGQILSQIVY